MNDVLNQNEIEDLLGNNADDTSSQAVDEQGHKGASVPGHYDFTENSGVVKNKFNKLEVIYDKFIRTFKISLYSYFKKNVEMETTTVEVVKARDFQSSIRVSTNINVISMNPLKGYAYICLDPQLIYALVDKFFGGEGKINTNIEEKDFTPTEYRIINNILSMIFSDSKNAWEDSYPVELELVSQEIDPAMLTKLFPFEYLVVKKIRIGLDGGGGEIQFAMPLSLLDPVMEKLEFNPKKVNGAENKEWVDSLQKEILEASVDVNCILATKKIKLGDVKNLKKGDIITIDIPELSNIKIGNIPVYVTKFGTHEGHYAVKIQSKIN